MIIPNLVIPISVVIMMMLIGERNPVFDDTMRINASFRLRVL